MSDLRALLQTDIVDSTRLTEPLGDEKADALWAAHDRMARSLIRRRGGREIERSDGFFVVFDSAIDAVEFALDYHDGLGTLAVPLQARAGLHVAPVTLVENTPTDVATGARPAEVRGLAVAVTARLMSLAQGGQTLLTAEAKEALGATGLQVKGHGHWRLKGVRQPVELFEVGRPGAILSPPPDAPKAFRVVRTGDLWLPVAQLRHSLPAERDDFIGRADALDDLVRRFEHGARLVSVVGIGGTGKTRLVQRFGWMYLGEFPGGVWFCDLSQARSLDGVIHAVAQGLDVPLGKGDPVAQLGAAISGRSGCLMILDNFEQVVRFAHQTIGAWLERAPEARYLVTTRETLNVPGESALLLAPMPQRDGTELFLRRAHAAAGFKPGPDDDVSIGALVDMLDGLPLAIELAAARIRVMPLRELQTRMRERLRVLVSRRGRHDRQATLRATFDWSWELLESTERMAFAQLSVFKGGFTLDAVERIVDLSAADGDHETVDVLQSLVEKSLVRRVSEFRFDMLPSVADYAAEHLRTAGRFAASGPDGARAARERHWKYFAGLTENAATPVRSVELDNLIEACRAACAAGDGTCATGALVGAWMALRLTGPFRVGVDLAAGVARVPALMPSDRANVCWVAGCALFLMGNAHEASAQFEQGLMLARETLDARVRARLLWSASEPLEARAQRDEALAYLQAALSLAEAAGDRSLACHVQNSLGSFYEHQGELQSARAHYVTALAVARELLDERMEGGLLGNLGGVLHGLGSLDEARVHYERALGLARSVGDRRWEGNTRCNLGLLHHDEVRFDEARAEFEVALAMAREMGHARLECVVLCNLGIVLAAQRQHVAACDYYEQAINIAHRLDDRRSEGQFRGYLGVLYARMGRQEDAIACLDLGEELLTAAADTASLGLLLCGRIEAEVLSGDAFAARRTLVRVEALMKRLNAGPTSELGRAYSTAASLVTKPGCA